MRGIVAAYSRLNRILCRIGLGLAAAALVAMTVIVFAQVYVRYVMNDSLLWVEPMAILLMSWFIFLGAAVGVYEGFHMGFDVLIHTVPERVGRSLRVISHLAVMCFGIGMIIYGWQLMAKTWYSTVPILGWPGGISYMPLFIGGMLITLFVLDHLLRHPDDTADADDILKNEA